MRPAAFKATIHGLKTIPTRKVVQLTVEFPIEELASVAAIAEHGAWVGIARLEELNPVPVAIAKLDMRSINDAKAQTEKNAVAKAGDSEDRPAPQEAVAPPDDGHAPARTRPVKQTWDSMLPAQQCGVLCNDATFWIYLEERKGWLSVGSAVEAADAVRSILNVGSRRDIRPGSRPATEWTALASDFRLWKQYPEYVGAA